MNIQFGGVWSLFTFILVIGKHRADLYRTVIVTVYSRLCDDSAYCIAVTITPMQWTCSLCRVADSMKLNVFLCVYGVWETFGDLNGRLAPRWTSFGFCFSRIGETFCPQVVYEKQFFQKKSNTCHVCLQRVLNCFQSRMIIFVDDWNSIQIEFRTSSNLRLIWCAFRSVQLSSSIRLTVSFCPVWSSIFLFTFLAICSSRSFRTKFYDLLVICLLFVGYLLIICSLSVLLPVHFLFIWFITCSSLSIGHQLYLLFKQIVGHL